MFGDAKIIKRQGETICKQKDEIDELKKENRMLWSLILEIIDTLLSTSNSTQIVLKITNIIRSIKNKNVIFDSQIKR